MYFDDQFNFETECEEQFQIEYLSNNPSRNTYFDDQFDFENECEKQCQIEYLSNNRVSATKSLESSVRKY